MSPVRLPPAWMPVILRGALFYDKHHKSRRQQFLSRFFPRMIK
jgi:hypothetical protein